MAGDFGGQISNWAGGGATTTLGAAQLLYGLQDAKGNKRPEYTIPPEVAAGLSEAERQALQGIPEAQKQQYIANLQRGTAYGLSQIGSRKGGLTGLAALNEQQNQGYYSLLGADSAARMQKQQNIFPQLQNVADYKGQEFQLNKLNPFYERLAKDQALQGAGMQNISQGFQSTNSGYDWGKATPQNTQGASRLQSNQAPIQSQQQIQPTVGSNPPGMTNTQASLGNQNPFNYSGI